jgi:hypothetical protein
MLQIFLFRLFYACRRCVGVRLFSNSR